MGSWTVDKSRWPIVVHSVVGTLTDSQVDDYVREATEVLHRGEPFIAILDASKAGMVSAHTRSRTLEFQRVHRAALQQHCLGTVYVLASPLLRFVVMTLVMVTRLPTPYRVCETLEEALAWSESRIADYRAHG